jgi:hypothetical protein
MSTVDVVLPAAGRRGRAPVCPYELGVAGSAWWVWAWTTPQATRWDKGALYTVARRARLEDDVDSGKLAVEKEMRELDGKLGLTPKAMADLGWTIGEVKKEMDGLDQLASRRSARLAGGSAA